MRPDEDAYLTLQWLGMSFCPAKVQTLLALEMPNLISRPLRDLLAKISDFPLSLLPSFWIELCSHFCRVFTIYKHTIYEPLSII